MTSGLDWYYQARERASRPTYQAQQGQNWWTMAQQIYGNPGMAGVLSKANPNTYTIRAGQQVNAPKYENTMAGVRAYDATRPEPRRRLQWGEPQPMPPGGYPYPMNTPAAQMASAGAVGGASGAGGYRPQHMYGYSNPNQMARAGVVGGASGAGGYSQQNIPLGVAGAGGYNMPGATLPGQQYPSWYTPYGPYGYSMYAPYGPYQPPPYQYSTEQAPPSTGGGGGGGGYSPPRGGGGGGGRGRSTGYGPGRMFDTAGQYNAALLGSTSWRI